MCSTASGVPRTSKKGCGARKRILTPAQWLRKRSASIAAMQPLPAAVIA